MATIQVIEEYLKQQNVPYATFTHALAYTAQEEAAVAHIPGRYWAKTVVCIADDEPIQAVVSAHLRVDLERLRALAGAGALRLAREDEVARLFPGCDVGAMPPLGPLYRQRVFVDEALTEDPEIAFNAGTHTLAIRMRYSDFVAAVHPIVGSFARR